MLTNANITIFNRVYNQLTRSYTYHGTVLKGVWWFGQQKTDIGQEGITAKDVYTVRIPYEHRQTYVEPAEYTGEGWTLAPGDFIAKGEHPLDVERPGDLNKTRKPVFRITGWDSNDFGNSPHWKVTGE